jgi:hypothetical protein
MIRSSWFELAFTQVLRSGEELDALSSPHAASCGGDLIIRKLWKVKPLPTFEILLS